MDAAPDTPAKSQGRLDDEEMDEAIEKYVNRNRRGKSAILTLAEGAYLKQVLATLVEAWLARPEFKRGGGADVTPWRALQQRLTRMRGVEVDEGRGLAAEIEAIVTKYTGEDALWAQQLERQRAREEAAREEAARADAERRARADGEEDEEDEDEDEDDEQAMEEGGRAKYVQVESAFEPARVPAATLWSGAEEQQLWLKQVEEARSTSKIAYLIRAVASRCANLRAPK